MSRENLGEAPANATANAGCWRPGLAAQARALGTEAWVATARKRQDDVSENGCRRAGGRVATGADAGHGGDAPEFDGRLFP